MARTNVSSWINSFNNGEFNNPHLNTQIEAGWWDWFCRDTSLPAKTRRMGKIIAQIKSGGKVDVENFYIWFKNNCPMSGPLYDDFRIANISDGEVQFTTQINSCWNKSRYAVYGRKHVGGEFSSEPLFETNSSRELVKWFNKPWED